MKGLKRSSGALYSIIISSILVLLVFTKFAGRKASISMGVFPAIDLLSARKQAQTIFSEGIDSKVSRTKNSTIR